ncbi:MAG: Cell_wall_hydrolase_CwlJ [uncultured Sphingomonas sp.]|uniref:Cell_wall_hydrolase_CwlJ n=1 Tax=uncultured Sphingomonas sp. TaxID=158754 RepID=A0A6J4T2S3_9SPHN|nr:MAG: Cell_wall_hydrolase_CwlJ [uncultured Sphingomonas sp.]
MIRLLGGRGASAVAGILMLALGSSGAAAQDLSKINVQAAVQALDTDTPAKPLGQVATQAAALIQKAVVTTSTAVTLGNGTVVQAQPAKSVTVKLPSAIAAEVAWLQKAGWPLYALVDRFAAGAPLDEQANCIAVAIYHEARGESLEGQLAVARVIMNRAASGRYPSSWCGTVRQPWQFSFVNPRTGDIPYVDQSSASWRKALGVTRLAVANAVPTLATDVLWYHADYVAPSWGRRLSMVQKIGTHIFYRS